MLYPPFLEIMRTRYCWKWLRRDFFAGLTVSIIAIPMALALSIAMGISPEKVIWSAIIAGVLGSFFGGSRFQISGPTAIFVLIIYQTINEYGYDGLALATCLSGVLLIIFGISGLGKVIHYIPYPVVRGFLFGVSFFMIINQIKDFFGLPIQKLPPELWRAINLYGHSINNFSHETLILSFATLMLVLWIQKLRPKYPAFLIGVLFSSFASYAFSLNVAKIDSIFPSFSIDFPSFELNFYSLDEIINILPTAFSFAFLGGIESLLSASLADSMTGTRHDTNKELIAQGIANIGTGFLGGIPVTSAMGRTLVNIRAGAKSQFSGIIQSFFILIFLMFCKDMIAKIPLCALSALLMISAMRMIALNQIRQFIKGPGSDIVIFVVTLGLTLITDLATAVRGGISLALLFFVMRLINQSEKHLRKSVLQDDQIMLQIPEHIKILRLDGPFFFGITSTVEDLILSSKDKAKILDMREVPFIDSTGLNMIQNILEKNPNMRFVSKHRSVTRMLQQIGIRPVFMTLEEAVESIPEENYKVQKTNFYKT